MPILIRFTPVSYTHLDVYKRQVDTYAYYCATRALMENEGFKFKYYFDSDDEEEEYDASYDEMYSYCLLYTSRCV